MFAPIKKLNKHTGLIRIYFQSLITKVRHVISWSFIQFKFAKKWEKNYEPVNFGNWNLTLEVSISTWDSESLVPGWNSDLSVRFPYPTWTLSAWFWCFHCFCPLAFEQLSLHCLTEISPGLQSSHFGMSVTLLWVWGHSDKIKNMYVCRIVTKMIIIIKKTHFMQTEHIKILE